MDFIPKYSERVKKKEIIKKLEEENKKLKDKLNELTQNESTELNKLKLENEKLKNELIKANKIISHLKNEENENKNIKQLKDEIAILKYNLKIKDNEINDIKSKFQNNLEEKSFKYKDIIVINFNSMDSTVHYGIKCLSTDIFAEVEENFIKNMII